MKTIKTLVVCLSLLGGATLSAAPADDPLRSVMWDYTRQIFLGDSAYRFDDRVVVSVPKFAEDPTQVPVEVDATAFGDDIQRIVVWADLNPIQHIFTFYPDAAVRARVSLRFKVQQATPVRAAVLTRDGLWHVGGAWLDADGGGCTTPSMGNANPYWETHLGETKSRVFPIADGSRYKFRVIHPMDTGLADGIPEFFLQQVELRDREGRTEARMELSPPVSENPVITFDVKDKTAQHFLWMRDNSGNEFEQALREAL